MSTTYTLAKIGPILFAYERSGQVEIGIVREDRAEENYLDTDAVFDDTALIGIIVELVQVASYVSDDPEKIKSRVAAAIDANPYLRSMDWGLSKEVFAEIDLDALEQRLLEFRAAAARGENGVTSLDIRDFRRTETKAPRS